MHRPLAAVFERDRRLRVSVDDVASIPPMVAIAYRGVYGTAAYHISTYLGDNQTLEFTHRGVFRSTLAGGERVRALRAAGGRGPGWSARWRGKETKTKS